MKHRCPVCHKTVEVPTQGQSKDLRFFPFCSQRCKLIDLGAWLDGERGIAIAPDSEEFDEKSNTAIPPAGKP